MANSLLNRYLDDGTGTTVSDEDIDFLSLEDRESDQNLLDTIDALQKAMCETLAVPSITASQESLSVSVENILIRIASGIYKAIASLLSWITRRVLGIGNSNRTAIYIDSARLTIQKEWEQWLENYNRATQRSSGQCQKIVSDWVVKNWNHEREALTIEPTPEMLSLFSKEDLFYRILPGQMEEALRAVERSNSSQVSTGTLKTLQSVKDSLIRNSEIAAAGLAGSNATVGAQAFPEAAQWLKRHIDEMGRARAKARFDYPTLISRDLNNRIGGLANVARDRVKADLSVHQSQAVRARFNALESTVDKILKQGKKEVSDDALGNEINHEISAIGHLVQNCLRGFTTVTRLRTDLIEQEAITYRSLKGLNSNILALANS